MEAQRWREDSRAPHSLRRYQPDQVPRVTSQSVGARCAEGCPWRQRKSKLDVAGSHPAPESRRDPMARRKRRIRGARTTLLSRGERRQRWRRILRRRKSLPQHAAGTCARHFTAPPSATPIAVDRVFTAHLPRYQELRMRPAPLAAALAAGALLAGCSKPEPSAGAPTPNAATVDSAKATPDSTAAAAKPDSTMKDSTMMMKDSTMADTTASDTTKKN